MKNLSWFIERIGKRVYRDNARCNCSCCQRVSTEGVEILGQEHANYLYDLQIDFAVDGVILNYRDEK